MISKGRTFLIQLLGYLLGRVPEFIPRLLVSFLGRMIFELAPRKRRILLSNLTRSFPELPPHKIRALGRESTRQMVEFAFFAAILPFIKERDLPDYINISANALQQFLDFYAHPGPKLILTPHLGPQEALATLPALAGHGVLPTSVIYRPFTDPSLEKWIRQSRQRFGIQMISRKKGLMEGVRQLRENHTLALLFDQNAGSRNGGLLTFFDRVCSGTPLVKILGDRFTPRTLFLFPRREGFWRYQFQPSPAPRVQNGRELVFAANHWLEKILREDPDTRPSWLWMHDRWKATRQPPHLFRLEGKYHWLPEQNQYLGRPSLPRQSLFMFFLPEEASELAALRPYLRALREQRPDSTLVGVRQAESPDDPELQPLFKEILPLPRSFPELRQTALYIRQKYPEVAVCLTTNPTAHRLLKRSAAPLRIGFRQQGSSLISLHPHWPMPDPASPPEALWKSFFSAYGLVLPEKSSLQSSP